MKKIIPILILYILFSIGSTLTILYFESFQYEKLMNNDAFKISFYASLLQDIIFFGIIGLAASIYFNRSPDENRLEERIFAVANSRKNSQTANRYFFEETRQSLAYCRLSSIDIIVDQESKDSQEVIYRCHVSSIQNIKNMCRDIQFPVEIEQRVVPGKSQNGNFGQVTRLEVADSFSGKILFNGLSHPQDLFSDNVFKSDVKFDIPIDGEVEYRLAFTLFECHKDSCSSDVNTVFSVLRRYTDLCLVNFLNSTDKALSIMNQEGKTFEIQPGRKIKVFEGKKLKQESKIAISIVESNLSIGSNVSA